METKRCSACRESKPLTEFPRNRRNTDGLQPYCRICYNKYFKQYGLTPRGRYNKLRSNCYASGAPLNISVNAFITWYEAQPQTCYYCGIELVNGGARSGFTSLTIDRRDDTRGYELGNMVLACRRCNLMKGNWLTEQQTLEIARKYFVL